MTLASRARAEDVAAGKATYNYEKSDGAEEELPGLSVFYRNEAGEIFHTYSTYARAWTCWSAPTTTST